MTLFVATPFHGDPNLYYHLSMMRLAQSGMALDIGCVQGANLPRNRFLLGQQFLDSECSVMLCVDSDIEFTPLNVTKLLVEATAKGCCVSGCYRKKTARRQQTWEVLGPHEVSLLDCLPCSVVPAGFLAVPRDIYQKLSDAWGNPWWPDDQDGFEDKAFCDRLVDMGKAPMIHLGVSVVHHGDYGYRP